MMTKLKEHTIQDYLKSRNIFDVTFNNDGTQIAYGTGGVFKEFKKEVEQEVILQFLKNGEIKRFSHEDWNNFSPQFSTDGRKLAYLSTKEEESRLLILDIEKRTTEDIVVEGKAERQEWLNGTDIIIQIKDQDPLEKEKRDGRDAYYFEESPRFSSLWLYEPGSGLQRITEGIQIWDFSVNKNKIAAITSSTPYEWSWYESSVSIIDVENHKISSVYVPDKRQVAKPRLSPDNSRVAFLESLWSDRGVTSGDIIVLDIRTRKKVNATEKEQRSYTEMQWKTDNDFYALSNEEGLFALSLFSGNKREVEWSKYGSVYRPWAPSFSTNGNKMVISFESSKQRNEIILVDFGKKKEKVITEVNIALSGCKSYQSEKVTWKSSDGLSVYGLFRSAGKGSPLIVLVHGGPTGSSVDSFIGQTTIFLANGYSVFLPNYRGSTGKGREYAEKNLGDMGGQDLQDILSGLDYISKTKGIDRKNVFIYGGSYGGFMAAWAITQTDVFKGAIPLFGIADWVSFHGTSNLPTWDRIHYDEDPYAFNRFWKFSPLRYIDNIKTPVLLAHGIEDPYVPVGQFYQYYRALKDKGKEVKLLLFPREGHGFKEKKHIEQFYEEVFKWLKAKTG